MVSKIQKIEFYRERAEIAKAIAHPTRLLILDALAQKDRCVCELNALVKIDQSTLSKHLSILKNAGLVVDQKKGLQVYYHLKCQCILSFLTCAEIVLKTNKKVK